MKTKLVQVDTYPTNIKGLLHMLVEGFVFELSYPGLVELTKDGFLIDGKLKNYAFDFSSCLSKIDKVYKREELPWYECMEVGQTVLVKLLEYTASYAVVRKKSKDVWIFNSNDMYEVPASIVARYIPLIPEEVSKLAFDNVCN